MTSSPVEPMTNEPPGTRIIRDPSSRKVSTSGRSPAAPVSAMAPPAAPARCSRRGGVNATTVVVTAAFYSAYYITALHPRFLFVALPALFVLATVGVASLSRRSARESAPRQP